MAAWMVCGALLPWNNGMMTIPPDGTGDYRHDIGYRIALVGFAAVCLAWVIRARIELRQDDLVMRYMLRSRRVPLSEITGVRAGREGLSIRTRQGRTYNSPTGIGGKAPLASWLHRRTKADRIAEVIMEARPQGPLRTGR